MAIPVYAKGMHINDNGELVIDADALAEAGVRSVEIIEGQPPARVSAGAGRPTYGELEALLAEKGARIATLEAQLEAESNTSRHWLSTAEKIAGARDDAYEDCCALKMQIKELEAERNAANMAAEKASETSRVALEDAEEAIERAEKAEAEAARLTRELESSAKVEEAALVLIKLLNKCQLYGPADAVRETAEKLNEIIHAYDAQRAAALEAPESAQRVKE